MRQFDERYLNTGVSWRVDADFGGSPIYGQPAFLNYGMVAQRPQYYGPATQPNPAQFASMINSQDASLTARREVAIDLAMAAWSSVASISFTKLSSVNQEAIQIALGFTNQVNPQQQPISIARYPQTEKLVGATSATPNYAELVQMSGDVWLHTTYNTFDIGTEGFETLAHEIGHALGLNHTGSDMGDVEPPLGTAGFLTLPEADDYTLFSLMSYVTESPAPGAISPRIDGRRAITPMLYDIAAIQRLYGANTSYKGENFTAWSFSDQSHPFSDQMDAASPFPERSADDALGRRWRGRRDRREHGDDLGAHQPHARRGEQDRRDRLARLTARKRGDRFQFDHRECDWRVGRRYADWQPGGEPP